MSNRLAVNFLGHELKNPVMTASGTFGFGKEMAEFYDLNILGGISMKGTTLHERFGNPTPRIAECYSGMLNSVGLQNPGAEVVAKKEAPELRRLFDGLILANLSGFGVEEYVENAVILDNCPAVDMLELNISCPNVSHGGMAFGTSPDAAAEVTAAVKKAVKKPLIVKLSPNVTDIVSIAKAVEAAGADAITLINTLQGMRIDFMTGKPILAVKMGGFSGPAVFPVALRMVYQAACNVKIPIIGVGGISSGRDVIEMMSAGATAVQVGSANLRDPMACPKIISELPGLLDKIRAEKITDIIGRTLKY